MAKALQTSVQDRVAAATRRSSVLNAVAIATSLPPPPAPLATGAPGLPSPLRTPALGSSSTLTKSGSLVRLMDSTTRRRRKPKAPKDDDDE
jgi:hypothetical protein